MGHGAVSSLPKDRQLTSDRARTGGWQHTVPPAKSELRVLAPTAGRAETPGDTFMPYLILVTCFEIYGSLSPPGKEGGQASGKENRHWESVDWNRGFLTPHPAALSPLEWLKMEAGSGLQLVGEKGQCRASFFNMRQVFLMSRRSRHLSRPVEPGYLASPSLSVLFLLMRLRLREATCPV